MRIWHEKIIPKLCRQHLLAVWRESLGCYNIITGDKKGYRKHPATIEFLECPQGLHDRLQVIRAEMLARGYKPKDLPVRITKVGQIKEWESYKVQIEKLKAKGCKCLIV